MRKRIIDQFTRDIPFPASDQSVLNVEDLAEVELTSEDPAFPIESALRPHAGPGWRATKAGQQTIRLLFDEPQKISSINIVFQENELERTQEFVLRWSSDRGKSFREIVRQQYHFSPPVTANESEDYAVDLNGVMTLELCIIPDISGGSSARASLAQLRLA